MTCPDWTALARQRLGDDGEETAGWRQAVAHLRDCSPCRRAALALDPTLVFAGARRLAVDAVEVAELRRAVSALRRVREAESAAGRRLGRRAAMAAGLVAAALLFAPSNSGELAPAATRRESAGSPGPPWIENLDRPDARVYQWSSEELAIVLVVDESLDV